MRRITLAMLTLVVVVGACDAGTEETREAARMRERATQSQDTTQEEVARTSDGCALLARSQVEQALGFAVVMNDNRSGTCLVTPADGASSEPAVDFKIENRVSAYDYFAAQPDAQPVAGLGERAVWSTINEMTGNLVTVVGTRAIVVAIARADGLDARSRQQAEALTRAILLRL